MSLTAETGPSTDIAAAGLQLTLPSAKVTPRPAVPAALPKLGLRDARRDAVRRVLATVISAFAAALAVLVVAAAAVILALA